MKKIIKIVSLLLIFWLSFQNISFAIWTEIETEKVTKIQLIKKVIISKFVLKKQLWNATAEKYSKLMNTILEKYWDNEEVLNKLDIKLDDLWEKN